jgi:hypothetical protein
MKSSGRSQFNRNLETLQGLSIRETKHNGFNPLTMAPKANYNNVKSVSTKVQLVQEKMSDNATVKTTSKTTR